jgi:hypothetical protein
VAVLLVPLLWLFPKRMGPHFAAVRWPGVVLGHLCWTLYGIGCIAMDFVDAEYVGWVAYILDKTPWQSGISVGGSPTLWDVAVAPLTTLAQQLVGELPTGEELVIVVGVCIAAELSIVLVAIALTSYATLGERYSVLFARVLKLTLWSTSSLIVLGIAMQCEYFGVIPRAVDEEYILAAYFVWLMWIWIRSTARYAGPAEGAGWQLRVPRCEKCGYQLTGLTATGRCPECADEVAKSMPDQRVRSAVGPISYFRTFVRVLHDPRFFRTLQMYDAPKRARRFALMTAFLGGPLIMVYSILVVMVFVAPGDLESIRRVWESAPWLSLEISLACVLLVGLFASVRVANWSIPFQDHVTVAFFNCAWLIPIAFTTIFMARIFYWYNLYGRINNVFHEDPGSTLLRIATLAVVSFLAFGLVPLVAFLRFVRGLRQVRFANA